MIVMNYHNILIPNTLGILLEKKNVKAKNTCTKQNN